MLLKAVKCNKEIQFKNHIYHFWLAEKKKTNDENCERIQNTCVVIRFLYDLATRH